MDRSKHRKRPLVCTSRMEKGTRRKVRGDLKSHRRVTWPSREHAEGTWNLTWRVSQMANGGTEWRLEQDLWWGKSK